MRDHAGLRARVGVIETGAIIPVGQVVAIPSSEDEFAEALLNWRHDFTPTWRSELAAGALVLHLPGGTVGPTPAGLAILYYQNAGQELELRAARTVEPNVFVGAAIERNLVSLRAGLPIGRWQVLRLNSVATLERDSAAAPGGSTSTANILNVQAGARYQPGDMIAFSLDYTFRDQFAVSAAPGASPFTDFRRHIAMLTIEAHYPPAASTPPRSP
jgi:hypothetical protein